MVFLCPRLVMPCKLTPRAQKGFFRLQGNDILWSRRFQKLHKTKSPQTCSSFGVSRPNNPEESETFSWLRILFPVTHPQLCKEGCTADSCLHKKTPWVSTLREDHVFGTCRETNYSRLPRCGTRRYGRRLGFTDVN